MKKNMDKVKKGLVLLSGGLDSTVTLSICKESNIDIHAMTFDYGQRHKVELDFAKWQAKNFNCKSHKIFKIDLYGGSALTDKIDVPNNKNVDSIPNNIPVTYVPGRNIIFLSFAAGYAEYLDIEDIYIGVNSVDYSGYPDCREEFIKIFEKTINMSTKKGLQGKKFRIIAPLQKLDKKEIVLIGKKNGVDFSKTSSCYNPINMRKCGLCDACLLRKKGFDEANLDDN
tara:strand:+ start:49 stop:729 length:681 start_codon:yes stop_codon:yes gene_type:complete